MGINKLAPASHGLYSPKLTLVTLLVFCLCVKNSAMAHSAYVEFGDDGIFGYQVTGVSKPPFPGMTNPSGDQIYVANDMPGYLNQISGGLNGGATGEIGPENGTGPILLTMGT